MKKFEMFKRQDDKQVARFLFLLLCFLAEWRVSDVHAAEYKLVMSEEATVCQSLVKLANEGLLETKNLEDPARLGTPDLNFVNWEMASRAPSFQNHNGNVEGALFDINNDGQLDWVVRIQWAIGGMYNHEYWFMRNNQGHCSKRQALRLRTRIVPMFG